MLSDFGLCRRDEITTIPNGHEHVKRWCPHRSPFAAMKENRRPFVGLLGGRACTRRSRCCFPSPELDALKLDYLGAGASGMYFFAIDSASSPFQPANARFVTDDDPSALEQRFASPFHR